VHAKCTVRSRAACLNSPAVPAVIRMSHERASAFFAFGTPGAPRAPTSQGKAKNGAESATSSAFDSAAVRLPQHDAGRRVYFMFSWPGMGIMPSCCIMAKSSLTAQCSTALPLTKRIISIPFTSIFLPVAGMPMNSPLLVPRMVV